MSLSLVGGFVFLFLSLLSMIGVGGVSSSVVGTEAAARFENIPPLMFVEVILNVWGWGPGPNLSPSISCLFQVWCVRAACVCVTADRRRRITMSLRFADSECAMSLPIMDLSGRLVLLAGGGWVRSCKVLRIF